VSFICLCYVNIIHGNQGSKSAKLFSYTVTSYVVGYQLQRHGDSMNVTTGHCRVIIKTQHLKS